MLKGQVSYSRKVTTSQYENISIGCQLEFSLETESPEDALDDCIEFVERRIQKRQAEMGVN